MPTWAQRSFALVAGGGYLDRLAGIYPVGDPSPRCLGHRQLRDVEEALRQSDDEVLLNILLDLERFPFNDPYVSFLRKKRDEITGNPQTVSRICRRLRSMGLESVLQGLQEPKQANRQMGQLFHKWLRDHYAHVRHISEFESRGDSIIFLRGSGKVLRDFANQKGCGLQKQPDFVAKANGRYVVGEAKFIGTEGGNQNRGFDDALNLASRSPRNAITMAVVDGIVWIPNSGQMSERLSNFSGNALTVLLVDEFLASL